MKTSIFSLLLTALLSYFSLSTGYAQQTTSAVSTSAGAGHSLTVVISNINNRSGKLYAGLSSSQASFDGASLQSKAIDVSASGEITLVFDGLTPGRYAVRLYQDLNGNEKMDFEGQRPTEPFGISTIAFLMGPPDFDQASFELTGNKTVQIKLMEM